MRALGNVCAQIVWSRGAATDKRPELSGFEAGMLTSKTVLQKISVARFAGSGDLKSMVTQGSQSLALGLAMTAASQLDY